MSTAATDRSPAGFVALLRAAGVEYERDHARYLAVAMVYYALVSLIPLLLLCLAALGLLLRFSTIAADAQQQLLLTVQGRFGSEVAATVTRLLHTLERESIVATILSLGGLGLAGSLLSRHLRLAFRAIWDYAPPLIAGPVRVVVRTAMFERIIAFALVVAAGGLLLIGLVLIAATQWLGRLLAGLPLSSRTTSWLLTLLSSWSIAFLTFACVLKLLPPVPIRWRDVGLAAALCAIVWVGASELLALYAVLFGQSRSAYGALGALLAVMLWMNIVSQVLFFGGELSKVVATRTDQRPPERSE